MRHRKIDVRLFWLHFCCFLWSLFFGMFNTFCKFLWNSFRWFFFAPFVFMSRARLSLTCNKFDFRPFLIVYSWSSFSLSLCDHLWGLDLLRVGRHIPWDGQLEPTQKWVVMFSIWLAWLLSVFRLSSLIYHVGIRMRDFRSNLVILW